MSELAMEDKPRSRELQRNAGLLAAIAALIALVFLVLLWWQINSWYASRVMAEEKAQMAVEVSLLSHTLSMAINRRLARLDGLHSFVLTELSSPEMASKFEVFAAGLYRDSHGVLNFAVAPGGKFQHIYPLVGNEAILDYEPVNDPRPEIRENMLQMIETGETMLLGPVALLQGGEGMIARRPVYHNDQYWGFVNMVVRIEPLLDDAEIGSERAAVDIFVRNEAGQTVYGSPEVLERDPVIFPVNLGDQTWQLAAVPAEGWPALVQDRLQGFQVATLVSAILIASALYLLMNRQVRLRIAVDERTEELIRINELLEQDIAERKRAESALVEQENQYRSIFESISDGLFINYQGQLIDFNPAAAEMHGYSPAEFRELSPIQFIHPDSMRYFHEFIQQTSSGKEFRVRAVDIRKDGTPFHVEVYGTQFNYLGKPHSVAVVRDVTEQVETIEKLERRVAERTRELTTLLQIAQNTASMLEIEPLLGLILEGLKEVVDYTGATVFTRDGETLTIRAYRGPLDEKVVLDMHISVTGEGVQTEVVRTRQPLLIPDVRSEEPHARLFQKTILQRYSGWFDYIRSWMGVPLIVQDRVIGVLALGHNLPNYYNLRHAELAMAFASHAAVAIENARLFETAQILASLEEREKLARELHDSVSQALYGIALGIRTAQTMMGRADISASPEVLIAELQEPLDYVMTLAEAGLAEMRALIFELRPESLEAEGLVAALFKQAEAIRARLNIEVTAELCPEPDLTYDQKHALYRIAQEALNNIIKHARADRIQIRARVDRSDFEMAIQDDGVGFDPGGNFAGHLGLRSMRERAEKTGGILKIQSSPGAGTAILARYPFSAGPASS